MKALLVALVLFGTTTAFAEQVTYVDVPVDEAAMANAPADTMKNIDNVGRPSSAGHQKRCDGVVSEAAAIVAASQHVPTNLAEASRVVGQALLGRPILNLFTFMTLKGKFIDAKCGSAENFARELAKHAGKAKSVAASPRLEADASRSASNTVHAQSKAIRPVAQGNDGLWLLGEPSSYRNASK